MTLDEALETTKVHSVAGILNEREGLVAQRPFRSPHHTSSGAALVGGGANPKPVKFLWRTTEFYFWMNYPNSAGKC